MAGIDPNGEDKEPSLHAGAETEVEPEEIPSVYELIHTSPVSHPDVHNITEVET